MTRKDWWYTHFPWVMAQALDDIIEKQAKRYGLTDRSELARIIIGRFIVQYDQDNEAVRKILEEITGKILDNKKKAKSRNIII